MIRSTCKLLVCWFVLFSHATQASLLSAVETPSPAPPLVATDLSGAQRSLEEFAGKVVMINFWATWCPPCVKELPSMQALWEKLRQHDFIMLAVNVGEDHETVAGFLDSFSSGIDFPILLDARLEVVKGWPVFGLPTTFILDRRGHMIFRALGEREWTDPAIEEQIRSLMDAG
jgi:thiol-disulfide isomerase/thioredoxin